MTMPQTPEGRDRLAAALQEAGLPDAEMASALTLLASWKAPVPSAAETAQLIAGVAPPIAASSPVRRALDARPKTLTGQMVALLNLVGTQAQVCRPAFWLSSALVMALGVVVVLGIGVPAATALAISGPFLSYLGTGAAFRGATLGMLECELACPPSARQLTLARLIVILGYDLVLTVLASGALATWNGGAPLALVVQWLAPLLLTTGGTLLMSLRFPLGRAAAVAYVAWLVLLLPRWWQNDGPPTLLFSSSTAALFALAGLACLAAAVFSAPSATARLLRHP